MYKCKISIFAILLIAACKSPEIPDGSEWITDVDNQDEIFKTLVSLTDKSIIDNKVNDSLAFLVLPLKLSCPACRKKTIDSIIKHQDNLTASHFIIISSSEGRKNMRSYFLEEDSDLPDIENQLFLDSNHRAYKAKLVSDNPVFYYAANGKAYKKVSARPATIREDLREFFSGTRIKTQLSNKEANE